MSGCRPGECSSGEAHCEGSVAQVCQTEEDGNGGLVGHWLAVADCEGRFCVVANGKAGRFRLSARSRALRIAGVSMPTFLCATGRCWFRAPAAMPPRRLLAPAVAWRWTITPIVVPRTPPAIRCARSTAARVKHRPTRAPRFAIPGLSRTGSVPRRDAVPSRPPPHTSIRFAARTTLSSNAPDALRGAPSPRTARPIACDGRPARGRKVRVAAALGVAMAAASCVAHRRHARRPVGLRAHRPRIRGLV